MRYLLLFCIAGFSYGFCFAQDSISTTNKILNFPSGFLSKINKKTAGIDKKLSKQTEKYLTALIKSEEKLKRRFSKYDSNASKNLFANDPEQQYRDRLQQLKEDTSTSKSLHGDYLPYADSLQGSLAFLNRNPQLVNSSRLLPSDIQTSVTQLQQLQSKFQNADQVQTFIKARKDQIKQYLSQYTNLPKGISNIYQDYNKQLYYYKQQVDAYKDILNDPDKMVKTALQLLDKLPAFTKFMKANSFLAGLFTIPDNYGSPESMLGLQTRDQLAGIIQTQVSAGGAGGMAAFSQNLQAAQGQLQQLKDKISSLGSGGENVDIPNFQPNNQKTKAFLNRLEYGFNIQSQQNTSFLPATSELALTLGYKINNKSTAGIGASYNVGWGAGINHIHLTNQGLSLRSFVDIKAKGSFWISGGFEYRYMQQFAGFADVRNFDLWQKSALAGVTKKYTIGKKTSSMQLLYDFLYRQHLPQTQPLIFRIGYSF